MNSKTTRIWTTLRYLALIPLIALGILSIVGKGGGDTLEVEGCLVVLGGGIGPDCGPPPPPPPPPPLPTVAFQAATSATADEAAGNHAINLVLSSSTPTEIHVVVTDARSGTATPGTDYIQVGLTSANGFSFPHGAIQETFILTVLADTLVEGNETVDLQLVNVTGAVLGVQTTHEVTITDDDLIDLIDLSLSKTVNNATPVVGNSVVFTITVSNAAGMTDASGVVVTDALPVGYRYVSDDGGAATAVAGNTVTWTVGSLVQGSSASLDITATVMPGGAPYVNDAEVIAANETDLDSTPGDGTGDDFAMVSTIPTAPRAYINTSNNNTISVIDTGTNTVIDTFHKNGGNSGGIAVHPDGTRVYAVNTAVDAVSVIDTATNTGIANPILVGNNPLGVAVHPNGSRAYVANVLDDTVSVIDTATNTVTGTIAVGDGPFGVAVHPNGNTLYVANEVTTAPAIGTVSVVDLATNTVTTTITVGGSPSGIAVLPDGSAVYVSNTAGQVSVIDTATNTETTTVAVGGSSQGIAVLPDGTRVYVASQADGTVSAIDTTTNTVVAVVPVSASPNSPFGVAVTPDGNTVYATNPDDDTVAVIDTATNTVTFTIAVEDGPYAFGQFIWLP